MPPSKVSRPWVTFPVLHRRIAPVEATCVTRCRSEGSKDVRPYTVLLWPSRHHNAEVATRGPTARRELPSLRCDWNTLALGEAGAS